MEEQARTRLGIEADALFAQYLEKIETCVGTLDARQVWWRPNQASNSVGNLVLHLVGNLSQWMLAGLGGLTYERERSAEFAADGTATPDDLLRRLHEVMAECRLLVRRLGDADLARTVTVQGRERDGFAVVLHAVEHAAYHTGQIVFITKQLVGDTTEIEFYPHLKHT